MGLVSKKIYQLYDRSRRKKLFKQYMEKNFEEMQKAIEEFQKVELLFKARVFNQMLMYQSQGRNITSQNLYEFLDATQQAIYDKYVETILKISDYDYAIYEQLTGKSQIYNIGYFLKDANMQYQSKMDVGGFHLTPQELSELEKNRELFYLHLTVNKSGGLNARFTAGNIDPRLMIDKMMEAQLGADSPIHSMNGGTIERGQYFLSEQQQSFWHEHILTRSSFGMGKNWEYLSKARNSNQYSRLYPQRLDNNPWLTGGDTNTDFFAFSEKMMRRGSYFSTISSTSAFTGLSTYQKIYAQETSPMVINKNILSYSEDGGYRIENEAALNAIFNEIFY